MYEVFVNTTSKDACEAIHGGNTHVGPVHSDLFVFLNGINGKKTCKYCISAGNLISIHAVYHPLDRKHQTLHTHTVSQKTKTKKGQKLRCQHSCDVLNHACFL